jgi:Zn-dependent protease
MNVMLGVFNLIPISVLDGKKIISWNKGAWAFTLLALLGIVAALILIPWEGPYSEIGAILTTVPNNLYEPEGYQLMKRLASYINPYLPYFL